MGVRVTNLTAARISLPYPLTYILSGREVKDFEYVEYDEVINTEDIARLQQKNIILIASLDPSTAGYDSAWNGPRKFHLGVFQFWVDAAGNLRMKDGDAAFDLDGTVVGPSIGIHGATHTILGTDPIPNIEILEDLYTCTVAENVLDLVYESAANTCAKADASGIATMPAIGVIISKPSPTQCMVARAGEISGFVGLTPDAPYFASLVPGGIALAPPVGSSQVVHKIGFAKSSTILVIQLEDYVIRA